ncbi:MAG: S53 family peptidase [Burkholderiaceae bacterium]
MSSHRRPVLVPPLRATLLAGLAAVALTACGGGADAGATPDAAPAELAGAPAHPAFHMAAAQLDEPAGADVAPRRFQVDAALADLATARLTPARLAQARRARVAAAAGTQAAPAISATVYSPAQIRAAYDLPPLPGAGVALSAADAADLGAGQTIYLVDAHDHPNAFADLAKFSARFGLPACASVPLPASTALPLAPAAAGCTFAVAYTDHSGLLLKSAPAYDAEWAAEIALDVEWAHAIAPLARLVLIEVPTDNSQQLLGGVALANRMGPGVVSMSFGAPEGAWVRAADASFAAPGMTYVAAAGDAGAQVLWPAVSPKVLAVGGTSLQWNGVDPRYEAAWARSGGGVSAVEPLPAWQSGVVVPGVGPAPRRAVADVAFNANPHTGQYVALTAKGAAMTSWNSFGGTSIGTPQWAGLVAVANARRAALGKKPLGDFHAALYQAIATSPLPHAASFSDVVDGRDGACAGCAAAAGYDTVTGWGTPNAGVLLAALASDAADGVAPRMPGGAFTARTDEAFAASLNIVAPAGVMTTCVLSGAPVGLTVDASGRLRWASPVAGSYAFTATATTAIGLSASARYTLAVVKVNHAPTLASGIVAVPPGVPLHLALAGADADGDALTYAMTGAPRGLSLSSAGVLGWPTTVRGRWALRVVARDAQGLASAPATIVLNVSN